MSWLLNRFRLGREHRHQRRVRKLQEKQWKRIHTIESMYESMDFFGVPESSNEEVESGIIPDAREKYALYLLHRVGIQFIPEDALALARKFGPAIAAERVCRWLGLDYHKIAAIAPRVASETSRATMYFEEMQDSCEKIGINASALLPHIHFGSHDTRDILFESFRISSRIIQLYDGLNNTFKEHINWEYKRQFFINDWKAITTECLMQFYNQGILLSEFQKNIDLGKSILHGCSQNDPSLMADWMDEEAIGRWYEKYPQFEIIILLVHLSNQIREVDYRRSREWNRLLKQINDTDFDYRVLATNGARIAEIEEFELEKSEIAESAD